MWHGNRKVKVKTCLEDVIEPKLRKLTVKPDGRCMFRSIAKSLAYSKKLEMNDDAEKVSADMLREEAFKVGFEENRGKSYFEKKRCLIGEGGLRPKKLNCVFWGSMELSRLYVSKNVSGLRKWVL